MVPSTLALATADFKSATSVIIVSPALIKTAIFKVLLHLGIFAAGVPFSMSWGCNRYDVPLVGAVAPVFHVYLLWLLVQ